MKRESQTQEGETTGGGDKILGVDRIKQCKSKELERGNQRKLADKRRGIDGGEGRHTS